MTNVIEQLKAHDIPHTSYIEAIQYMRNTHDELSREETYLMIANLSDANPKIADDFVTDRPELFDEYLKLVLLYLVQESIRASFTSDVVDGKTILPIAVEKSKEFFKKNPWAFAKPEEEQKVDELTGKPKMKKGKKQELAIEIYKENRDKDKEEIMALFQEQLDMSKSGARTYYYNMRKKFEDDK